MYSEKLAFIRQRIPHRKISLSTLDMHLNLMAVSSCVRIALKHTPKFVVKSA